MWKIYICSLSAHTELGSHWTYFHEIWYLCIFRKTVQKTQVALKSDKNNGYFTWRPIHIFYNILLSSSENVPDKSCRGNHNTHFVFNNSFLKIMWLWNNVEEHCRVEQATDDTQRMCTACWIPKATNTHIYVVLIAFLLQHWFLEHTPMLCYTVIPRLTKIIHSGITFVSRSSLCYQASHFSLSRT